MPPTDAHTNSDSKGAKRIQSVDRAIDLLNAVAASDHPAAANDLADQVGLNRSTAWRLLMTLEHRGLLDRDPFTQHYVVGYEVLRLAASGSAHSIIVARAQPVLGRLAAELGETLGIAVPTPRGVLVIDQREGGGLFGVSVVGAQLPIHAAASGKARLAFGDEADLPRLLPPRLQRHTADTIVDRRSLLEELSRIRDRGWATESNEFEEGISGVAAPVFDARGHVLALLSLWGLTSRLGGDALDEIGPKLRASADELTASFAAKDAT